MLSSLLKGHLSLQRPGVMDASPPQRPAGAQLVLGEPSGKDSGKATVESETAVACAKGGGGDTGSNCGLIWWSRDGFPRETVQRAWWHGEPGG